VSRPVLERRLGPLDAAAIIVSNVIGGGIFLTPAVIAGLTGDAWTMIGVWLLGGAIAFAGAMA
jgi:APA family basic amino acid/polyamine antiporter